MEVFPSLEDLRSWADRLEEIQERLAPDFERAEPRQRAMAYIRGLVGHTERKNGWQLAELAGEATQTGCNACSIRLIGMRSRCVTICSSIS